MAKRIVAINKLRPKVKRRGMVSEERMLKYIADRTGLTTGQARLVLSELHDTVLHFNRTGQSVKFDGLGFYFPKVSLDGDLSVSHVAAPRLKMEMNNYRMWEGEIINLDNKGLTPDELVALWNENHPDDLVEP